MVPTVHPSIDLVLLQDIRECTEHEIDKGKHPQGSGHISFDYVVLLNMWANLLGDIALLLDIFVQGRGMIHVPMFHALPVMEFYIGKAVHLNGSVYRLQLGARGWG